MNTDSYDSDTAAAHAREHRAGTTGKFGPIAMGLLVLAAVQIVGCSSANGDNRQTTDGEALMLEAEGDTAAETRAPTEGWRTCTVVKTGAGWGNVYLRLTCNGVSERWFIARGDQKKLMLATGLTAITTSKQVQVYLEHKSTGYHEIRACYLLN